MKATIKFKCNFFDQCFADIQDIELLNDQCCLCIHDQLEFKEKFRFSLSDVHIEFTEDISEEWME